MKRLKWIVSAGLLFAFTLPACTAVSGGRDESLYASGVVEAVQVAVAPELGGRVVEVFVEVGDAVAAGDGLFRLEDDLLQAARVQAQAARRTADANLRLTEAGLVAAEQARAAALLGVEAAHLQLGQVLTAARLAEAPFRTAAWTGELPEVIDLPAWYFLKREQLAAAEAVVEAAAFALDEERSDLADRLQDADGGTLQAVEERLARATAAFLVAQDLLDNQGTQSAGAEIDGYVQEIYDSSAAELDAAQLAYDQLLSDQAFADVLEARARVAVAQERFDLALDRLAALRTGEDSPAVQSARMGVAQAEAAVSQADANVAQAQAGVELAANAVAEAKAALDAIDIQIEKLTVRAAVDGVILVRNIEPGEIVTPAAAALAIGRLETLTITVYIPENRYGGINLGDHASVSADSFPGQTFDAVVTRIADQAEFTPRNVQTQEERITTVFAVELSVLEGMGDLKPGMPADVVFGLEE